VALDIGADEELGTVAASHLADAERLGSVAVLHNVAEGHNVERLDQIEDLAAVETHRDDTTVAVLHA